MQLSIIDIGTQSIKHYIFEKTDTNKKLIQYKRYSEANLGESNIIRLKVSGTFCLSGGGIRTTQTEKSLKNFFLHGIKVNSKTMTIERAIFVVL